jgi:hypothetical protein
VAFVCDPTSGLQRFYIDGVQTGASSATYPVVYDSLGVNTQIGRHGNGSGSFDFSGIMDEVRVSDVARSEFWIKLSYENQKENSTVVAIE